MFVLKILNFGRSKDAGHVEEKELDLKGSRKEGGNERKKGRKQSKKFIHSFIGSSQI